MVGRSAGEQQQTGQQRSQEQHGCVVGAGGDRGELFEEAAQGFGGEERGAQ